MTTTTNRKETEIGMIPQEWEVLKLKDLIDIKHWFAFKWENITDEINQNHLLTPGNIKVWWWFQYWKKFYTWKIPEEYILKKDDIIVTMTDLSKEWDSLWFPAKIPDNSQINFLHNQRMGLLSFKDKSIDKDFLYWRMRNYDYQESIVWSSTWTTVKHTSPDRIKSYIFASPPIKEQQNISSILESIENKIELLIDQNKTLEIMWQTVFKNLFVEFKDIADFENSELWQIPKGWEVKKLTDIATFLNWLALQKYPFKELKECYPVIKIRELKSWITKNTDRCSSHIPKEYIIKDWDMLFSWSWSLDTCLWTSWEWALNQHLFKVSSEIYPQRLYRYWTNKHLDDFRITADSKATTMWHIKRSHLDSALVIVPDSKWLEIWNNNLQPILDHIISNWIQIQSLTQTRDSLLPMLMSWKVRVI